MTTRFEINGKKASLLGYGAMRLPTVDGGHANPWAPNMSDKAIDQKLVNRQVRRMLDLGINYFDTANAYTDSEKKIGLALSDVRENIIIATKSMARDYDGVLKSIENSLKTMKTDYIDLFQLHNVPQMVDPEDTDSAYAGALEAKKREGISL
mgnify:CR=1 FL=1